MGSDAKLKIGVDAKAARREVRSLGNDVSTLGGKVKGGQERIEKFATAVTGASSVLGGLGSKAGATAGAVSNLLSAFLAGGPALALLAAGTTAAAFATSELADQYSILEENAKRADTVLTTLSDNIAARGKQEIDNLKKSINSLNEELNGFYMSAAERRVSSAFEDEFAVFQQGKNLAKGIAAAKGRIGAIEGRSAKQVSLDVFSGREEAIQENLKAQKAILANLQAQEKANQQQLKSANQLTELAELRLEAEKERARLEKRRRKIAELKKTKDPELGIEYDATDPEQVAWVQEQKQRNHVERVLERQRQKLRESHDSKVAAYETNKNALTLEQRNKAIDDQYAAEVQAAHRLQELERKKVNGIIAEIRRLEQYGYAFDDSAGQVSALEQQLAAYEQYEEARTFIADREAQRRHEAEKAAVDRTMEVWGQGVSFVAGVTSQLFEQTLDILEQVAAGQEVAFDQLAAAFIRSIGTQIFSIGLKTTAEGLALAPTLLLPGGQVNGPAVAAHLAIGSSLMTAGGTMAASGAVAQGLLARNTGGGGGGALASGGYAPAASDGPVGRGNGGETVVINFNGGTQLGDPSERARLMSRDARRAARTVYTPRGSG